MIDLRTGALGLLFATTAVSLPAAEQPAGPLAAGTPIQLETAQTLSSKTAAKGDLVNLTVRTDVLVGDRIVVPKGTPAIGQVSDARAKGAMGMSGRLVLRPLYLRAGTAIVRLDGEARDEGTVTAGAVLGLVVLSPGFTGRSAELPEGTALTGRVLRDVYLTAGPTPAP